MFSQEIITTKVISINKVIEPATFKNGLKDTVASFIECEDGTEYKTYSSSKNYKSGDEISFLLNKKKKKSIPDIIILEEKTIRELYQKQNVFSDKNYKYGMINTVSFCLSFSMINNILMNSNDLNIYKALIVLASLLLFVSTLFIKNSIVLLDEDNKKTLKNLFDGLNNKNIKHNDEIKIVNLTKIKNTEKELV